MKDKRTGLFSLSKKDYDYFDDKEVRIELVSCPLGGQKCTEHRSVINKNLLESQNYLLNKDYSNSIESLKTAYNKASDLPESSCVKCSELFRFTVTKSLENIHGDLHKMSQGYWFSNRFRSSFELAKVALAEFKKGNSYSS